MIKDVLRTRATTPAVAHCVFRDLREGRESILRELCETADAFEAQRPGEWEWLMAEIGHFPSAKAGAILMEMVTTSNDEGVRRSAAHSLARMPHYADVEALRTAFDSESSDIAKISIALALRRAGDRYADAWVDQALLEHANDEYTHVYDSASYVQSQPHGPSRQ